MSFADDLFTFGAALAQEQRDLSKGRDNAESKDAFRRLKPTLVQSRMEVLHEIRAQRAATLKTLCAALGKEKNQISGRISELKKLNLIEPNGMRADGCAVVVITQKGKEELAR